MEQIRVCTYDGPGAQPVIRTVPWPKIPSKAALIKVGACGVCGTDLHILKGHWPRQLPWPFTLGHEIGGMLVEVGSKFTEDFMSKPLTVGSKVMIPPLMPCGRCYYCIHYPQSANKCLTPVYYGRYLGFDKAPHLWGGWAEYVYVDLDMLPGTKIYKLPDDMSLRLGALSEPLTSCIRAFNRATRAGGFSWGDTVVIQGSGPIGILAIAAAQQMGAGRVICVGAPERPRLELARRFGAEATVNIEEVRTPEERIARVTQIVRDSRGSGIVYAATIAVADALHAALQAAGVPVGLYHGALGTRERREQQAEAAVNRLLVARHQHHQAGAEQR